MITFCLVALNERKFKWDKAKKIHKNSQLSYECKFLQSWVANSFVFE